MPYATDSNSPTYKVREAVKGLNDGAVTVTAMSNFRFSFKVPARYYENENQFSEALSAALGEVDGESFRFTKNEVVGDDYISQYSMVGHKSDGSSSPKAKKGTSNIDYVKEVLVELVTRFGDDYKGKASVEAVLNTLVKEESNKAIAENLQKQFGHLSSETIERMVRMIANASPEDVNPVVADVVVKASKAK